jgi:ubiquinone/menaquinone biosynthesis C-methylase UbiE
MAAMVGPQLSSNCNSLCFFVGGVGPEIQFPHYLLHYLALQMTRSPNAEYIGVWNDVHASRFTRYRSTFVGGAVSHSEAALARHPVAQGARVLDVGCGFGETTIGLARAAGPGGQALGIDVTEPFLTVARADAAAAGVNNVAFRIADAQIAGFEGERFDLIFSRFGTMFFANPVAALRNLRRAMAPDGRLLMIVWRRVEENSFANLARRVARRFLPPPPDHAPSCAPGPFSMGDPDVVRAQLAGAGWTAVALEQQDADFVVGATVDDAIGYLLTLGPGGQILRDAGPAGEEKRPEIAAALAEELRPFVTPAGVALRGSSWCVTARA